MLTTLSFFQVTYTTYVPASDPRVIACFTVGFVLVVCFGLWEQFSGVKYPLCPTPVFKSHRGREFTAPFCLSFIVVGFFYGLAVIYPTMLSEFNPKDKQPLKIVFLF
jgi:hypothetical protein